MGAYSVSSSWIPGGGGWCASNEDDAADEDEVEDFRLSLSSSVMRSGSWLPMPPPLFLRGELRGIVLLPATPLLIVPRLWLSGLEFAWTRERLPVENGEAVATCGLPSWTVLQKL